MSHHPSIVIWDGCNECESSDWGAEFVPTVTLAVVAANDDSRPVWPACPSLGWASGVDRLTGLPNGSPAGLVPVAPPGQHATRDHATAPIEIAASPSDGNCSFVPDVDIPGACTSAPSPTPADCCAQCYAAGTSVCWAAVWSQNACYFKSVAKSFTTSPGAVACWPTRDGPPPPVPPVQ